MLTTLHLTDSDRQRIQLFLLIPFHTRAAPTTTYMVYTRDVHVFNDGGRSIHCMLCFMYNNMLL